MTAFRFVWVAALAAIVTATAACSNAGGVVPAASFTSPLAKDLVKITEFSDLPEYSSYYGPSAIASGPKKSLWVTDVIDQDFGENAVVQISSTGAALNTYYYSGLSTEGSSFAGIAAGPDGNLWITDEYNEQILRMTPAGSFTGFKLAGAPFAITNGPDKALWFTEYGEIGRITTSGHSRLYGASGGVFGIATGPDGALWFTELSGNAVGRATTHGKIKLFTKGISSGAGPYGIAAGPDGALWFTEATGGRIGRITTSGKVTEYSHGITTGENPVDIAAGPDGAMWFTESEAYGSGGETNAKIGRITTSGKVTEYSKDLTSGSYPTAIAPGPDGNMWFVEAYGNKTGRVKL